MKSPTLFLPLCFLSLFSFAQNWPQWRGPTGNGFSEVTNAPASLDPDSNLLWELELPGPGASTPIVWDGHILLTCTVSGRDTALCLDLKGQEQWRRGFGKSAKHRHRDGSGANPSPITDGTHFYVYFMSGEFAALTLSGERKWQTNLQERYGESTLDWDLGTSPVLAGGNLVVAVMQDGNSYLVSLDCKTGKEVWKVARTFESVSESYDAYTTPLVTKVDGRETVICWGADHISGNAADTGELLWHGGSYNPARKANWRVISSPTVADDVVVVPLGRGRHLAGMRLGQTTDVAAGEALWQKKGIGADVPSLTSAGKFVYVLGDKGTVNCVDAATGDIRWHTELPANGARFYASPVLATDRLYCAATDGSLFTARVTAEGLADINKTNVSDSIAASPVVLEGRVLIRSSTRLFCFGRE